tara:strand:+ start:2594 stop:3175 length:582 start_codon:yes stop_codon:yes gene_type:complete
MPNTTHKTNAPVRLEGFNAVLKPSQFGYSLKALVEDDLINTLEQERSDQVEWCVSKLKNPKRKTERPVPWEEVADGKYTIKFSWGEDNKPPIYDTEGSLVTDPDVPLYEGSLVKLAFYQKPYLLRDGVTYGTSLKLRGVQIVTVNSKAGVDNGELSDEDVKSMFGTCEGYKTSAPNPQRVDGTPSSVEEEDDF